MQPIRVLMFLGEPIANGGQEKFILNMLQNFDTSRVVFDIFSPFEVLSEETKEKFEALGCVVSAAGLGFDENKNEHLKTAAKNFFANNKYNIVHIHSGSIYALMTAARIARKSGAKRVIVHSHCGGFANLKYRVIKVLSFYPMLKYPTDYFACSHLAARWKFPTPIIKKNKYTVIKNAVDLEKLHFDKELRDTARARLGLENNLVLGHVGRFALQKNHSFLLDVFAQVLNMRGDARLVLVGEGELLDETLAKAKRLGIDDKIIYLGVRRDIDALMNAFDVFVMPSFFEGLPIVGVEAQATGLPVVTSTGVTRELPIDSLCRYIPLESTAQEWANEVLHSADYVRRDTRKEMADAGYEIKSAAAALQKRYEEMV